MTVGEIHEKILELDDLLVKADMGDIPMEWDKYQTIAEEADGQMSSSPKLQAN
jgi:hypothetical protein